MGLTQGMKEFLINQANQLSGYAKRHFMADAAINLLAGNQSLAERELGWNRKNASEGTGRMAWPILLYRQIS